MQAKLDVLKQIMGLMDDHMLAPLKAKHTEKQKAAMPPAPAAVAPEAPAAAESDDLDDTSAAELRKLYEDEDLEYSVPTPTT